MQSLHLFLYNILTLFSAFASLAMAFLIMTKGEKRGLKITLTLAFLSMAVYCLANFFGANIQESSLSLKFLRFVLSVIFISIFSAHSIFLAIGKTRKYIIPLILIYTLSLGLFAFFIINPGALMLTPTPKMYFPNYTVPGEFFWMMLVFSLILVPIYLFSVLIFEYFKAEEPLKSKIKFIFFMFFTGYLIGSGNGPLAYNIELDPLFAAPFVIIGGIFFVYGSTYYEMMEIKIAAKGAFIYAVLVSCVGLILGTLNFVNSFVPTEYYEFLSLFFSFSIGGVLVGASAFIFRRIRQTDILRYEFMNIMTHKFLTPLNRIKWSAEELRKMNRPEEEQFISIIAKDSERLIEMMKLLSFLGDANSFQLNLHPTAINPSESAKTVLDNYKEELSEKNLNLKIYISSTSFVSMSLKEFTFILETLIDNAIKYTPANGNIVVSVSSDKKNIEISVSDTGIGISKDDLPYVFQKFYRGEKARTTYTEGMGIGLSTVKNVVKRNKGKIKALSKGMHQGTTFVVTLPIYKNVYGKLPAKI